MQYDVALFEYKRQIKSINSKNKIYNIRTERKEEKINKIYINKTKNFILLYIP